MLTIKVTFNMKALTFTWATHTVCDDNAESEVAFCPMLVILFQQFFSPTLLTYFLHKAFFTLVCTLFVRDKITCEMTSCRV